MNDTYVFPDIIVKDHPFINYNKHLFFYNYKAYELSVKNRVIFKTNIINFILSGHKTIHTLNQSFQLNNSQCMIIKNGNCLTSEQFPENGRFNSLTLFFDTKSIQEFIVKHSKSFTQSKEDSNVSNEHVFVFDKDQFIENYIASVSQLLNENTPTPTYLIQLKFEEIMLYLLHKSGNKFLSFIKALATDTEEIDFRIKMENESLNKLTLDEMAFLCNMSLSTFKRNFMNTFGISPQKWFQNKRLEFAYDSLKTKTKTPSELYLELGYSSLSSFSVAFTNIYGVPPTKVLAR